jgi:hypothetical protein
MKDLILVGCHTCLGHQPIAPDQADFRICGEPLFTLNQNHWRERTLVMSKQSLQYLISFPAGDDSYSYPILDSFY